jgi:beta-glucosidase-like glycosyl hydrolase/CubicO group peptidase (beta-lactamase class C family)
MNYWYEQEAEWSVNMWKIRIIAVLTLVALAALSCVHAPRTVTTIPDEWRGKPVQVQDLSLREQAAQLIMVRIEGFFYSADNGYRQQVEQWVAKDQVGGLITFRGSADGTFTNLQRFQRLAPIPLLVASDFERGVGQQVEGATMFPSNMAVAATFNEENAYEQGRVTALESRALGVHITFAPVMDINNNPGNPIINFRAYSDDPGIVTRMGTAFIRGAQDHGLLACAKHYPGHGNTATDSHTSLPLIPGSRESLEQMELAPFKAATEAGVKIVMAGHIAVPGLDESNLPATQSNKITEGILRGEYGYEGLIVTDGMEMGAITGGNWTGEAGVRALEAGNDMILLPLYVDQTIDAIVRAVKTGRLSKERIEASVRRVLKLKKELGLYEERKRLQREDIQHRVGVAEFGASAKRIAKESITLVKDDLNLIPIKSNRRTTLTHILISMDDDLKDRTLSFWRDITATVGSRRVKTHFVNDKLSATRIKELVSEAKSSKLTLVTALVRIHMDKGVSTIDSTHQELLKALKKAKVKFAVASFGSPYLPSLAPIPTYLCAYAYGDLSMRAMADAIFGRADITGRLPVNLDQKYLRGHGLRRSALFSAFEGKKTQLVDFRDAFSVLDSAIQEKITPGAQVCIARQGYVLADTAFGHFTYDEGAPAVTTESIYDLASVTKVLVGGTLAMELTDRRYLVLDEPVWHYLPTFRGEWKDRVTIRHLLTHSSGLPPFLQFWKLKIKPEEVLDVILQTDLDFEPGTQYQYSDLGMILFTALTELITGEQLAMLAKYGVFTPLMMQSTVYNPPADQMERIVPTEYDGEIRKAVVRGTVHDENTYFMGGVSAHAGAFAQANELASLGMLYLNGGVIYGRRLVQEETINAFIQPQNLPEGSGRALCWQMASSTGHAGDLFSESTFGHTGFTGTSIWIDPESELIVVLLTNRVHPSRERGGMREIRRRFHNAVARAVQERGPLTIAVSEPPSD